MNKRVEPALEAADQKVNRIELVERLWQAAQAQVAAHETRLRALAPGDAASEAHAKALATLARTLKELIELEAVAAAPDRTGEMQPDDAQPDGAFDSYAALQAELARRLAGLRDGGAGRSCAAGEPDPPGG